MHMHHSHVVAIAERRMTTTDDDTLPTSERPTDGELRLRFISTTTTKSSSTRDRPFGDTMRCTTFTTAIVKCMSVCVCVCVCVCVGARARLRSIGTQARVHAGQCLEFYGRDRSTSLINLRTAMRAAAEAACSADVVVDAVLKRPVCVQDGIKLPMRRTEGGTGARRIELFRSVYKVVVQLRDLFYRS
jgi:hypothetical protein